MKKFLALYLAPASVIEKWKETDPAIREEAEAKMRGEWNVWMKEHEAMFTDMTAGTGKTKRVTAEGISDVKNDVMLYSVVEAESHEAAAKAFEGHPHLGIGEASIEVMEINPLTGM
jgi:hypothetical protein